MCHYTKEEIKKSFERIEQGQMYEVVTDSFFTSGESEGEKNGFRSTHIKKGTIIEIRYPYERHFRTDDNYYFHATPKIINENTLPVGKIRSEVKRNNKANLEEIIRLKLFTEHEDYAKRRNQKYLDKLKTKSE